MDLNDPLADLDLTVKSPLAVAQVISDTVVRSESHKENDKPFLRNTRQYLTEGNLTERHRNLLDFIEQYWYMNSAYPSVAAIGAWAKSEGLDFKKAREVEKELAYFLSKRGIKAKTANSVRLTDTQLAAANLVLNFMDRRSPPQKLKSLGVTPTEWQGWLKQPAFADYLKHRTGETLDANTHEAHLGLLKAVERGDASALKLYYEITGAYKQNENPAVNLQLVVSLLIEVIEKNIPDPAVKLAISKDVELVMLRSGLLSVNGSSVAAQHSLPLSTPVANSVVENDLLTSALQEIEQQALPVAARKQKTTEEDDLFNL